MHLCLVFELDTYDFSITLQDKTGGKVIYERGGALFLFRGRNYNYRTRPRFPLMLWKPASPVYPRLVKRVPDGLTLEKATIMRRKGRTLIPICKLGDVLTIFTIMVHECARYFFINIVYLYR